MSTDEPTEASDWWAAGAEQFTGLRNLGRPGAQSSGSSNSAQSAAGYDWSSGPAPGQQAPGGYGGNYSGPYARFPTQGPGSLANVGTRFGARVLDALFTSPLIFVALFLSWAIIRPFRHVLIQSQFGGPRTAIGFSTTRFFEWFALGVALYLLGFVAYEAAFTHWNGRTPGKAITRIRPRWTDGPGNLSLGRAVGRSVAYLFWGLIPYVGWLLSIINVASCLWNPKRQCWHDRLCSTVVVADG